MSGMSVTIKSVCTIAIFGLTVSLSHYSGELQITWCYTSFEGSKTGPGSGAYGINRFGATVGTWADAGFHSHGFYRSPQGKIFRFSVPKFVNPSPQGSTK